MIDALPAQGPGGGEKDYPMRFDFSIMGSKPLDILSLFMFRNLVSEYDPPPPCTESIGREESARFELFPLCRECEKLTESQAVGTRDLFSKLKISPEFAFQVYLR